METLDQEVIDRIRELGPEVIMGRTTLEVGALLFGRVILTERQVRRLIGHLESESYRRILEPDAYDRQSLVWRAAAGGPVAQDEPVIRRLSGLGWINISFRTSAELAELLNPDQAPGHRDIRELNAALRRLGYVKYRTKRRGRHVELWRHESAARRKDYGKPRPVKRKLIPPALLNRRA